MRQLPVIDLTALRTPCGDTSDVARLIDQACRQSGFFLVTGHGIDPQLADDLDKTSRIFFALPESDKSLIAMEHGGTAWRGWFAIADEVTSGVPDQKEGLYFGTELNAFDPRVRNALPLHGANLFPTHPAEMKNLVLRWMDEVTALGRDLLRGIALGLGIEGDWFNSHLTADPTILFRIFAYPPLGDLGWGVGEHTDYGLLTMLWQDDCGGLEVFSENRWLPVEPIPNTFVCNIGDMLERLTNGLYRSTPHRVRNISGRTRLSLPLFYDPSWTARVIPLPIETPLQQLDAPKRWDGADLLAWSGSYGDYLTSKVSKAFPKLEADILRSNRDS